MRNYYTQRNYLLTENSPIYFKTVRLKPNNLFRNFLIKENADNASKYLRYKKKEILPEYSNIRKRINHQIKEIKSYFDIKNTIFKEIKSKDIIAYSKFAKDMTLYFFGPKGKVTEKNPQLKRYYNFQEEQKKIGLNTKIYAGRWEYYDDTTKFNRYLTRLKSNRKKILKIGGHFSTEDDINQKIHALYLKKKSKDSKGRNREEKKRNKKRFSTVIDIKKINLYKKNFFEYTSIEPRKQSIQEGSANRTIKDYNYRQRYSICTLPNTLKENKINNDINSSIIKKEKEKDKNKTMYKRANLKKIKNIFVREHIEKKLNKQSKSYFKKLKTSLNIKLNSIIKPSKDLLDNINTIKKNNETNYTQKNNKDKYKEDIKVIGEDDKKENNDNMKEFVKTNYKNKIFNKKDTSAPRKIHFSYYDKSKDNIHNSIKEFIKNIGKMKQEEREKKYGKNVREQFESNCRVIEQLGMNLDNLKIKSNI